MDRQAPVMNSPRAPAVGLLGEISEVGQDLATLAALQAQLAAADLRETTSRAMFGIVAGVVAVPLSFACFGVALLGAADFLETNYGFQPWSSKLIVALAGLIVAALLAALAASKVRSSTTTFRRSKEELDRNLAWLKTVMANSGRG